MNFLHLNKVSKKYSGRDNNSVDEVSFSMQENEVLSIVGENGSGKTTILKLIYGLEDADSGEIHFEGEKVTGPSENLVPGHPKMKIVEQDLNLFPRHTIKENILFDLRFYSTERQKQRLSELTGLFRLQDLEDKIPAELSGGQQQRAALAKAIAANSPLLLLDEPFSNLDIMLKDEIKKQVIRTAKKEGIAVIFVTHDVNDALSLSDKIAVMRKGKIIQFDTPQNIYERPTDEYVAYLFGKINILLTEDFLHIFPQLINNKKISTSTKVCFSPAAVMECNKEECLAEGQVIESYYSGNTYETEIQTGKTRLKALTGTFFAPGTTITFTTDLAKIHLIA